MRIVEAVARGGGIEMPGDCVEKTFSMAAPSVLTLLFALLLLRRRRYSGNR